MQPLQGKKWFLLASPQGGAPLALGYYMQPCGAKKTNPRYSFAGRPLKLFQEED
jgi:hypothetical protein